MKTFLWLTVIILIGTFTAFAQTSICPKVSVIGPSGLTKPGDSMTFTANISGGNQDNPKYNWTVSAGTITSGQGTSAITVATTEAMQQQTVTVTVEVNGFPAGCMKVASASGEVERKVPNIDIRRMDQYEHLPWRDEKMRIDSSVMIELKNDESAIVYYIISSPERVPSPTLKKRFSRIIKHLTETRKIAKERIKIGFKTNNKYQTEVYIVPPDAFEKYYRSLSDQIIKD